MIKTQYNTVSSKIAKANEYDAVTSPYRVKTESDILNKAIETFYGRAIALVSDDMGDTIQIWRKKSELKYMGDNQ